MTFKKTTMMQDNNKKAVESLEVTYRPSFWPRQVGVSLSWFWERALNRALSNRRFACSWRGLRVTSAVEISGLSKAENTFHTLLSEMTVQNAMNVFFKCFHVLTAIQKAYDLLFPRTLDCQYDELVPYFPQIRNKHTECQKLKSYVISFMDMLWASPNL